VGYNDRDTRVRPLSALIREGARRRPQSAGGYEELGEHGLATSNAWGAAYEAFFGDSPYGLDDQAIKRMLSRGNLRVNIVQATIPFPVGEATGSIFYVVKWMGEGKRYSREQIADYLKTLGY